MSNPSEDMLSVTDLQDRLTSGLENLSGAEANEAFSDRLGEFLRENNIDEAEIISGESEYASTLSEAAFNGVDFRGLEGTGLPLADARRLIFDEDYRLEMADKFLTGKEENRIEAEHSEIIPNPQLPFGPPIVLPMSPEGVEAHEEAVKTKEFMHYELRDALNSGKHGLPATLKDFEESENYYKWEEMKGDQAAFHQNGGTKDLKFVHPDGRELVYEGDTKELMTSDAHMGTYNYANATIPKDLTPSPLESFQNTRTEGSKLHKAYDVDPWIELGNTRADRYANGGEAARAAQLRGAVLKGLGSSTGNSINEGKAWVSDKASEVGEAVSDTVDQVGDTIHDTFEKIKNLGKNPWQEGTLNPSDQTKNGAHIQSASFSETDMAASSGTLSLEDAIGMLAADQKTLNASIRGETSSVLDVLNHPDAALMFQNLQSRGVNTLTAEITPDMSTEDRVRELLVAGHEATQEAGIPMPEEQRELEAMHARNNSYEDDYSLGV